MTSGANGRDAGEPEASRVYPVKQSRDIDGQFSLGVLLQMMDSDHDCEPLHLFLLSFVRQSLAAPLKDR